MQRLDQLLVSKGLVDSRTQSQKMIAAGQVEVRIGSDWKVLTKASTKIDVDSELRVTQGEEQKYVSRAGLKLEGALAHISNHFSSPDFTEITALDIGQSTGGFTDCLVQHKVDKVVGIDVGHGQLSSKLKKHDNIVSLEGINARHLPVEKLLTETPDSLGFPLVVMDVSFISQALILPELVKVLATPGLVISLVKPQFEVGPDGLGKGGIVKDAKLYGVVKDKLLGMAENLGLNCMDYIESPIKGGDGNREFFMILGR